MGDQAPAQVVQRFSLLVREQVKRWEGQVVKQMVPAMLIGMVAGTAIHVTIGVAMSPLLGMVHCMVPGGLIGMYGGMLFAMRDVMQPHAGSAGPRYSAG